MLVGRIELHNGNVREEHVNFSSLAKDFPDLTILQWYSHPSSDWSASANERSHWLIRNATSHIIPTSTSFPVKQTSANTKTNTTLERETSYLLVTIPIQIRQYDACTVVVSKKHWRPLGWILHGQLALCPYKVTTDYTLFITHSVWAMNFPFEKGKFIGLRQSDKVQMCGIYWIDKQSVSQSQGQF